MVQHFQKPEDDFSDLRDLENQLRNFRPRVPHVELAATVSEIELPDTSLLEPSLRPYKFSWRFAGSMAASLAAGLVIGASGMFYKIQQSGFGTQETSPTIGVNQVDLSKARSLANESVSPGRSVELAKSWKRPSSNIENIIEESTGSEFGEILRAGEHLLIAKSRMVSTKSQLDIPSVNEQAWSSIAPSSKSEVLPSTSSRLMRDLLESNDTY